MRTLLQVLEAHAQQRPGQRVFTWVDAKCAEQDNRTYEELWHETGAIAALLAQHGCVPGDRVMIAYP